jgi:DNA polymerase (family 10)
MALATQALGKEYFGICDHSKSAFYANGLSIERVAQQHAEIDKLNQKFENFRIFKGIESDILSDGSLDYPDEVLASFDFIVASVHSVLRMDEERATARLIKAVENPFTSILGHCSGRILLKRFGYPLDYEKVIDACISNHVAIELNAHPSRLDMDWQNLARAIDKGAIIAINPDAHEDAGMAYMQHGVWMARKAGAPKELVLNALSLHGLIQFLQLKNKSLV